MKRNPEYQIAIVGLGPKGFYSLERLLAQFTNSNINIPATIHLFNKTPYFGAGDIYRPDQPAYLTMNFSDDNIDIRPIDSPPSITPFQNYVDWKNSNESVISREEISSFSSRATVGKYYIEGFNRLLENRPGKITIRKHVGEVVDVVLKDHRYSIIYTAKGKRYTLPQPVHSLLLTTGHGGNKPSSSLLSDSGQIIDYLYPVDEKLKGIKPNSKVGIKGMGLTFIDAALALTEGRGGTFKYKDNKMIYLSSVEEPHLIYPYSRSGLLMIPKTGKKLSIKLRYFTRDRINRFNNSPSYKYNFENDLLPEITKEIVYQYYKQLFRQHGLVLNFHDSFDKVEQQILKFHRNHQFIPQFSIENLINPIEESYSHPVVEKYLENLIDELAGDNSDPLLAAITVWNEISPLFNELYSFGGLDACSHKLFDKKYFGIFNRISYGPPLENMTKILALTEAKKIDFSFAKSPNIRINQSGKIQIRTTTKAKTTRTELNHIIDARIPKTNLDSGSVLFQNMIKRELVFPYRNVDKNGYYIPGCIDVNKHGHPVTKDNSELKTITLYGTSTEGITFDNDTLSRHRNNMASHWAQEIIEDIINYCA